MNSTIQNLGSLNDYITINKYPIFPTNQININNKNTHAKDRIIQYHIIYLIGLPKEMVSDDSLELLQSFDYLGQYGKITRCVLNKKSVYNSNAPKGPSYGVYISFSNNEESSLAILAMNKTKFNDHDIKASFGTTKYCNNFLSGNICTTRGCMFLHSFADPQDVLTIEEMNTDEEVFARQREKAVQLSKILTLEKYNYLLQFKDKKTVFPNCFSVYSKDIVVEYIKKYNLESTLNFKLNLTKNKQILIAEQKKKIENSNKDKKNLFETKKESRFFNSSKDKKNNGADIPLKLSELISRQLSMYSRKEQSQFEQKFPLNPNYKDTNNIQNYVLNFNLESKFYNTSEMEGEESVQDFIKRKKANEFKTTYY